MIVQGLDQMGANKGAGPMLVLAALREHSRLRDGAIEVSHFTFYTLLDEGLNFNLSFWLCIHTLPLSQIVHLQPGTGSS